MSHPATALDAAPLQRQEKFDHHTPTHSDIATFIRQQANHTASSAILLPPATRVADGRLNAAPR